MPNFFQLYHECTKNTEPPPNFHAWSAIAAISALLGKKCHIPQGHFTVFPNLYLVLVGTPGTRKSTAMNIAKKLVRRIEKVPVAADSGSREGLIDDMAKNKVEYTFQNKGMAYWQCSAFATEMQEFLGGKHINSAMVGFLTAIWDESIFKERTRKGGEIVINNPYFSFLGCCSPNWMSDNLKNDVITDGFSRRTIFALEDELNCLNPWPEDTAEDVETMAVLTLEANRIFQINGQFELSMRARHLYDERYLKMRDEGKKYSEKVQNYFTSKHILALKIAMCLSAGINSIRLIDYECMNAAFDFLAQSERALDFVFSGVGRNEMKSLVDKGLQRIRTAGAAGMTKAEFLKASYDDMNKQEIDEAWDVLMSTGAVEPVSLSNAQEIPRVRATVLNPLPPAVNLLRLASQIVWRQEEKMAKTGAFSIASHLAPETEQLLADEAARKRRIGKGVLLLGKRSPDADVQRNPSKKPA